MVPLNLNAYENFLLDRFFGPGLFLPRSVDCVCPESCLLRFNRGQ
jgi:hypothetical protein